VGVSFVGGAFAAPVIIPANGDAQIREAIPEQWRSNSAIGGPITELAVRAGSNNDCMLVRFNLASMGITTAAQLGGYADLRIFARNTNNNGNNASGQGHGRQRNCLE
jgi:hypothetical protein